MLLQTTVAVRKADDCDDIRGAGLEALAQKLVRLGRAAGWELDDFVGELTMELEETVTDKDFAIYMAQRRARAT